MKKRTVGIAVYPVHIPANGKVTVGVWIARRISSALRTQLMSLDKTAGWGHIGVRTNSRGTTLRYMGTAASRETEKHLTPRQIAERLAKAVKTVLGTKPALRPLRNIWQVEHALKF